MNEDQESNQREPLTRHRLQRASFPRLESVKLKEDIEKKELERLQYIKFFGETDEMHELRFVFEQLVEELGRLKVSVNKALDRFEALEQRKKR